MSKVQEEKTKEVKYRASKLEVLATMVVGIIGFVLVCGMFYFAHWGAADISRYWS